MGDYSGHKYTLIPFIRSSRTYLAIVIEVKTDYLMGHGAGIDWVKAREQVTRIVYEYISLDGYSCVCIYV